MYFLYIILLQILLVICQQTDFNPKLCVIQEKFNSCLQLKSTTTNAPFQCVGARDRIECLHKVENGEADITTVPSNEAYAVNVHMKTLVPLLEEQRSDGDFMYESVAVVKSNTDIKSLNDLKNKKACHTGYKRTAGWDIPIAYLIAKGFVPCSSEDELADVSSYFGQSCVPGEWSKNPEQNINLKTKYRNLCQLCDQLCNISSTEKYAGYEGALKCLMEKSADIAFTKYSVVQDFAKSNTEFTDNYRLLCLNGSLNYLNTSCYWGARPNPLVITRNNISVENRANLQTKLIAFTKDKPRVDFFEGTILTNSTSNGLRNISGSVVDHLEKANFSITMIKPLPGTCRKKYARLCVNSELDVAKCKDFKMAAFAARLRPTLECILEPDCSMKIVNKESDFIVTGLKASYDALISKKFSSAMTESFFPNKQNYYLVAVIKTGSTITKLKDLQGKKSCHSNFKCGASWYVPKGVLASKKLIKGPACKMDKQMSEFFASSCVPEAPKDLTKLCSLCKGDAQNKSKCSYTDEYAGFVGAFRCLVQGGGDVAFIPHSLVRFMTDNANIDKPWAKGLKSTDFKLLCTTDEVKTIFESETCNWANVPGRQLLFSSDIDDQFRQSILLMLTRANYSFGLTSATFKLYSQYQNSTDVIFTNGTTGLVIQEKKTINDILGENVVKLMNSTYCKSEAYTNIKNNWLILLAVSLSILRFSI